MEIKIGNFDVKFLLDNSASFGDFSFSSVGLLAFCKVVQDKVEKKCNLKNGYIVEFKDNSYTITDTDRNKTITLTKEEAEELNRIQTLGM